MNGNYKSLIDMIDGGGAGRSGDTFQGGGILSELANMIARPYGYEDRLRNRKNNTGRAVLTAVDQLTNRNKPRLRPTELTPMLDRKGMTPNRPTALTPVFDRKGMTPINQPQQMPTSAPSASTFPPETIADISTPEFEKFVKEQRKIEAELGMQRMSLDEIVAMFREYKQRGY